MRSAKHNPATRPLGVGVIGLGHAGEAHLAAYTALPGAKVVALAGLERGRLDALSERYQVVHLYDDYRRLIARDDIEAVSVCVPNHLHAPVAVAALKHGKHVLCEKPLARSGAEAAQMVRVARRQRRVLKVAFNHRSRGDVQTLRRFLKAGELGRIYHVKASWLRRSGIPGMDSWFTNREMAGGGPLIDLGVHVLDLALYLLDEPRVLAVSAATHAELGPYGRGEWAGTSTMTAKPGRTYEVEDLATAFLRLEGGATLLLEAAWAAYCGANDDLCLELFGSDGGAEIRVRNYNWEAGETLRLYSDKAGVPVEMRPQVGRGEGHGLVVREFVAAVQRGEWQEESGEEGLTRALIIDACYASALKAREVAVCRDAELAGRRSA